MICAEGLSVCGEWPTLLVLGSDVESRYSALSHMAQRYAQYAGKRYMRLGEIVARPRRLKEVQLYEAVAAASANKSVRLLDFGCGDGTHMRIFRGLGVQEVYGLDVDEKYHGEDVEIDCDSISFLQRHKESFDVIFARESLYYLERDRQPDLFRALYGALRADGILVAICFNGVLATSRYIFQKDFGMQVVFNEISMQELASAAGFRNLEVFGIKSQARTPLGQLLINVLDFNVRLRCSAIHFLERRRDPFFPKIFTRSIGLTAQKD